MILGLDKIQALIINENPPLISNLANRELFNPEGTGIDIRAGIFYKVFENDSGFLENDGNKERRTPNVVNISAYQNDLIEVDQSFVTLSYQDYFLVKTIERFAVPIKLAGFIFPRTTLFRSGVQLFSSLVSPGYGIQEGGSTLTFGLINLSRSPFRIQLGARIAQIVFMEIDGIATPYRGPWQDNHGKVSTDTETQK